MLFVEHDAAFCENVGARVQEIVRLPQKNDHQTGGFSYSKSEGSSACKGAPTSKWKVKNMNCKRCPHFKMEGEEYELQPK